MVVNNKQKVEEKKDKLIQLTTDFSQQHLNKEYDAVIVKVIEKMARKKDVPFLTGRIEIWAAAVVHAVGTINFLFDKNTQPYISATDIINFFGTKQSTTSQKSKKIRDMFNMTYFDENFSIETNLQQSPLNSLTMINGLLVPQNMVNEQIIREDVMEYWEIEVARLLGISNIEEHKKYSAHDKYNLLQVNYDRLMIFYEYLQKHITFPFPATFEEEVGPLDFAEYHVTCKQLDQEIKVDEFYGIFVEIRQGRKKGVIPLAELEIEEESSNFALLDLYHYWFWNYR